jgi:hypothetical protein
MQLLALIHASVSRSSGFESHPKTGYLQRGSWVDGHWNDALKLATITCHLIIFTIIVPLERYITRWKNVIK